MQNDPFSSLFCFSLPWLGLSFLVGLIGSARQIKFWGAFFLSLFLSPLVGLIVTLLSRTDADIQRQQELFDLQHQQMQTLLTIQNSLSSFIADELVKLKKLADDGAISASEFEIQRRRLLQS